MKRWLIPALVVLLMAPLVALATGTLTIPVNFGALTSPANTALLDQAYNAIRDYINVREITQDVCANRPAASTKGRYYFCTDTSVLYGDTGSAWTVLSSTPVYTDELSGLGMSNVATNQILVGGGATASDDATIASRVLMTLASATQGNTAGVWTVGNFQNKLDVGGVLGASQTWHNFIIERTDTGVVDILFSQSATAPTLPTNYTKKRRVGFFMTDGANAVRLFHQYQNDFMWDAPIKEVDSTNPGVAAMVTASASCPNGVKTQAILHAQINNVTSANALLYISAIDASDLAPSAVVAPLNTGVGAAATTQGAQQIRVWTNTAQQFRFRLSVSGAADVVRSSTIGCMDPRGRG